MTKPDMTVAEMETKACSILRDQDYFVIAYDIVDSKKLRETTIKRRREVHEEQKQFNKEISDRFKDVLAEYRYSSTKTKTGMHIAKGDAAVLGLSDPSVIKDIIELASEIFSVRLRWSVGKETYDTNITSLIK